MDYNVRVQHHFPAASLKIESTQASLLCMVHICINFLNKYIEVLLSQFEWNSRDSLTETRLTDRYNEKHRFFVIHDSRQFPARRDHTRNDVTYALSTSDLEIWRERTKKRMARRPSLRESLGLPTRVDAPPHAQSKPRKVSGLGAGGGRPSTAANRRRTQVLARASRPSSVSVGQGRSARELFRRQQ